MAEPAHILAGRVALLTGASGGIGGAIARRLGAAGTAVGAACGSNADAAESLVGEIVSNGGRAVALAADLRHADAPAELVDSATRALGPVEILVANAGLSRRQELDEVSSGDFDEMLAVNLRAPFLLAQRAIPAMRDRGFGRIVFMSSVAAFTGGIIGPHYAASKAGLHGLVHFLASRLASAGITVNAIAPALIEGPGCFPGAPSNYGASCRSVASAIRPRSRISRSRYSRTPT
jgi:3-oxoacyl-[acyl-carrier protein] reductase